jgi:hypothetical protein
VLEVAESVIILRITDTCTGVLHGPVQLVEDALFSHQADSVSCLFVCLFLCLFACFLGVTTRCGSIFLSPVAGFSLLVFEVS